MSVRQIAALTVVLLACGCSRPVTFLVHDAVTEKPLGEVEVRHFKQRGNFLTGKQEDSVELLKVSDAAGRTEGVVVKNYVNTFRLEKSGYRPVLVSFAVDNNEALLEWRDGVIMRSEKQKVKTIEGRLEIFVLLRKE